MYQEFYSNSVGKKLHRNHSRFFVHIVEYLLHALPTSQHHWVLTCLAASINDQAALPVYQHCYHLLWTFEGNGNVKITILLFLVQKSSGLWSSSDTYSSQSVLFVVNSWPFTHLLWLWISLDSSITFSPLRHRSMAFFTLSSMAVIRPFIAYK